jgi:hypothetical protein
MSEQLPVTVGENTVGEADRHSLRRSGPPLVETAGRVAAREGLRESPRPRAAQFLHWLLRAKMT